MAFDYLTLKVLSLEDRIELVQQIRRDPELWDIVHRPGGLSESSEQGRIIGQVTQGDEVLKGATIELKSGETLVASAESNQYGSYIIDVAPGTYMLTVTYGETTSNPVEAAIEAGLTISEIIDIPA